MRCDAVIERPRPRVSGSDLQKKKKVHTLMETARVADTAVAVVVVLVVAYIVVLSESDVESARRVVGGWKRKGEKY